MPHFVQCFPAFCKEPRQYGIVQIGTEFATSKQQKNQLKGVGHRQDGGKV